MYSFELTCNCIDNNEQKIHMFFFPFLNQIKYKFLCIGAKNVRYETSNNNIDQEKECGA